MRLLKSYLETNVQRMMDNNVRIAISAAPTNFARSSDKMAWAAETTSITTDTLTCPQLRWPHRAGGCFPALLLSEAKAHQPDRITEEDIHRHLYTAHMPIRLAHSHSARCDYPITPLAGCLH